MSVGNRVENRLMSCAANMFCAAKPQNITHKSQWKTTEDFNLIHSAEKGISVTNYVVLLNSYFL